MTRNAHKALFLGCVTYRTKTKQGFKLQNERGTCGTHRKLPPQGGAGAPPTGIPPTSSRSLPVWYRLVKVFPTAAAAASPNDVTIAPGAAVPGKGVVSMGASEITPTTTSDMQAASAGTVDSIQRVLPAGSRGVGVRNRQDSDSSTPRARREKKPQMRW
jgi:hypothetical protein